MIKTHRLFEGGSYPSMEDAQNTADRYCKGLLVTSNRKCPNGKEYHTVLKGPLGYYVTNRYDPRVVQWCKENNVKPRD